MCCNGIRGSIRARGWTPWDVSCEREPPIDNKYRWYHNYIYVINFMHRRLLATDSASGTVCSMVACWRHFHFLYVHVCNLYSLIKAMCNRLPIIIATCIRTLLCSLHAHTQDEHYIAYISNHVQPACMRLYSISVTGGMLTRRLRCWFTLLTPSIIYL